MKTETMTSYAVLNVARKQGYSENRKRDSILFKLALLAARRYSENVEA
jgi:hypothetical protein